MYRLSNEKARKIYEGMKAAKIDFVLTLPCGWLRELINLCAGDKDWVHVGIAREEEGVGIAAGAYLGGKKAAMIIQNHGLGNSVNALASLMQIYHIPLLLMMSDRGYALGEIRGHFRPLGQAAREILRAIGIPYYVLDNADKAKQMIVQVQAWADGAKTPVALLLSREALFEGSV